MVYPENPDSDKKRVKFFDSNCIKLNTPPITQYLPQLERCRVSKLPLPITDNLKMPLSQTLSKYRANIQKANSYIKLAYIQDSHGHYIYSTEAQHFITDVAFLKMFMAWESFLEASFTKYLLGQLSATGNVIHRYVFPKNYNHAHSILINVDWDNPEMVRQMAKLYFEDGEPFETYIKAINSELFDLRTIRNAALYLSSSNSCQLDALATRLLKTSCSNINVSQLILSIDPNSSINQTILDAYQLRLDIAAKGIASA